MGVELRICIPVDVSGQLHSDCCTMQKGSPVCTGWEDDGLQRSVEVRLHTF
jgi:hypothetical protein